MSVLGFDALGHFPPGHPPDPAQSAALTASAGNFLLTGQASGFTFTSLELAASFALTGVGEAFKTGEATPAGSFLLGGVSATFSILDPAAAASFALGVLATADTIGEPVNPFGAFALTGLAAPFSASFGVVSAGSFGLTTPGALLTRDFVNWIDRPLQTGSWTAEGAPSPSWTAIDTQASAWRDTTTSVPAWSAVAPPRASWTIDPAQHILPPVSK